MKRCLNERLSKWDVDEMRSCRNEMLSKRVIFEMRDCRNETFSKWEFSKWDFPNEKLSKWDALRKTIYIKKREKRWNIFEKLLFYFKSKSEQKINIEIAFDEVNKILGKEKSKKNFGFFGFFWVFHVYI